MKIKIVIIVVVFAFTLKAQTVYELVPGTKGNEITLQLSNVSGSESANNVEVKVIKSSNHLNFIESSKAIDKIETSAEKEIIFLFDVNYNTNVNTADTLEFLITDNKKIYLTKSFVFNYTKPKDYSLEQNFPNPFNPSTKIRYTVPDLGSNPEVILKIYDILGKEIATLVNEKQAPGYKEIDFNGSNLASGVYIYRLSAGDFVSIKKMMLIK
ncbi:MAG: T9SS type A sorting domain-containing protein [Ignavibacteriaceae bacterium]|nr:T9SS type A sorting domain-containing protein [Ignavibacteriaceae bacterium]HRN26606.1 T9SS type A sorting domain-containing protein [Ignavibacteriaceae bacterium]HRP92876.1 T9SS type A sorting domain-containing protein [Ignavibacteriaceae bacterium]HRQ54212.1 T9SS type A sorting domain-containing protein [Ignavibacteriaceae bacterium]